MVPVMAIPVMRMYFRSRAETGVSTGNVSGIFAGTLGYRVRRIGNVNEVGYITNSHVGAANGASLCPFQVKPAKVPVFNLMQCQPGRLDAPCSVCIAPVIGQLVQAVPLVIQRSREYGAWMKRDLSQERYVYWWVADIYSSLRSEDERLCLLVIIGVLSTGEKRFVAISDGFRESAESWKTLLRELKERGLQEEPRSLLAMGRWDSGRRWLTSILTPEPNAAGCTRWSTCSIVCRNRCKRRPSRNCRPFGWRRRARAPIRPLTASFAPAR